MVVNNVVTQFDPVDWVAGGQLPGAPITLWRFLREIGDLEKIGPEELFELGEVAPPPNEEQTMKLYWFVCSSFVPPKCTKIFVCSSLGP